MWRSLSAKILLLAILPHSGTACSGKASTGKERYVHIHLMCSFALLVGDVVRFRHVLRRAVFLEPGRSMEAVSPGTSKDPS
jgi:hypothetical protein